MDGHWGMKLLANQVHIQGMEVLYWLTKCINKNHNVNGYVSHNHLYISSSNMADAMPLLLMYRDGCMVLVYALCQPV